MSVTNESDMDEEEWNCGSREKGEIEIQRGGNGDNDLAGGGGRERSSDDGKKELALFGSLCSSLIFHGQAQPPS